MLPINLMWGLWVGETKEQGNAFSGNIPIKVKRVA
jgi:hypothetical protein